ncbi:hypothetical protein PRIPAC_91073, partial [Pristionchus pacificus]|uniref:ZT_dimer domain-containing protein n=1 Tax=Pristionchus pacificus TaxID=54126 RepID=A0A2A6B8W9_PRIPA
DKNGGFPTMYVYIGIGVALSVAVLMVVIFFVLRMRRSKTARNAGAQETKKIDVLPKGPEPPQKKPKTTIIKAPDPPKYRNLTPSNASSVKATESLEEMDAKTKETSKTDYADKTPDSGSHPTQPSTSSTLITDVSTATAAQNDIFEHLGEGKQPKLADLDETLLRGVLVHLKERLERKEDSLARRLVDAKVLPVLFGLFAKRNFSVDTLKLLAECLEILAKTNRTDLHVADMKKALVARLEKIDKTSATLYPHILTLFVECQPDSTPRLTCSSGYVPLARIAPIWLETFQFAVLPAEWGSKIMEERGSQLKALRTTITVLTTFLKEGILNVVASERSVCIEFVLASLEKIDTLKFVCYGIYAISNDPDARKRLIEPRKRLVFGIRAIVDLGLLSDDYCERDPNGQRLESVLSPPPLDDPSGRYSWGCQADERGFSKLGMKESGGESRPPKLRKLLLNILISISGAKIGASHVLTVMSDLIEPSAIHGDKEIMTAAQTPEEPKIGFLEKRRRKKLLKKFYDDQAELLAQYDKDDKLLTGAIEPEDTERRTDRILNYLHIGINVFLLFANAAAAVMSGSLSIISTVVESAMDLTTSSIMAICLYHIRKSDYFVYPRGRERLETVGVILCSVIMGISNIVIILHSISVVLNDKVSVDMTLATLIILLAGCAVKAVLMFFCFKRGTDSAKVIGMDMRNDIATSAVAIVAAFVGDRYWKYADPLGASIMCSIISINWFYHALEHIPSLTGVRAEQEHLSRVLRIAIKHDERIQKIDHAMIYHTGAKAMVEMHIVMDHNLPLKITHDISHPLEKKLNQIEFVDRSFVHCDYECDAD